MTPDLRSPRSASPASPSTGGLDPALQELVHYVAEAGSGASVRGASRELDVDPATIRRYRTKLIEAGYDMSPILRRKQ